MDNASMAEIPFIGQHGGNGTDLTPLSPTVLVVFRDLGTAWKVSHKERREHG